MSRYSIFGEKQVVINSESIQLNSQELLWNGSPIGTGGEGITQVGLVGGAPNASGATVLGDTLFLRPAGAAYPGLLAVGDQQLPSGNKHFQNNVTLSDTNGDGSSGVFSLGSVRLHNAGLNTNNLFLGPNAGNFTNETVNNVGIGPGALQFVTNGDGNVVITNTEGFPPITSGGNNIILGYAGYSLNGTESNNILLQNSGRAGEEEAIRVGDGTLHTAIYFAGIEEGIPANVNGNRILWVDSTVPGTEGRIMSMTLAELKTALNAIP